MSIGVNILQQQEAPHWRTTKSVLPTHSIGSVASQFWSSERAVTHVRHSMHSSAHRACQRLSEAIAIVLWSAKLKQAEIETKLVERDVSEAM